MLSLGKMVIFVDDRSELKKGRRRSRLILQA